jgi:iron complex outermembrane receptor protein
MAPRTPLLLSLLGFALALVGASRVAIADDHDHDHDHDVSLQPVLVPAPLPADDADRAGNEVERAPANATTVIRTDDFAGEAKSTPELLSSVPGAVVRDYGGPGQLATISLRGASSEQVLILLDGVPVTSAEGATVNLATLPAAFVDRIEVIRGPVGALYGPGSLGGAVNLVTRTPSQGPPSLRLALSGGSFETGQVEASGAGSIGPGALLICGTALGTRGDFAYAPTPNAPLVARTNNDSNQLGTLGRYVLSLGNGRSIEVLAQASGEERGLAGTAQNPSSTDRLAQDRETISAQFARRQGSTAFDVRPFVRRERTQATLDQLTLGESIDVLAGVEGDAHTTLGHHGLSALIRAAGESLTGPSGAHARPDVGLGGADEWLLSDGRFSVMPSVRVDRVDTFWGFSPQLGAVWRPLDGIELKSTLGRSFRPPSFGELYVDQGLLAANPLLKPESGDAADLTATLSSERFALSVGGFGAVYQDLIVYELYPPFRAKPFNIGTAGVAGIESQIEAKPWRALVLSAGYTYQLSRDLYDTVQYYLHELPYHPRHTGSARVAWRGTRVLASVEALFQSAQFTNRSNTTTLDDRLLMNADVQVRPLTDAPVWAGLEAKNLLDDRTEDLYGYPLPGRALFATLRLDTTPALEELR